MRPRLITAENLPDVVQTFGRIVASMRPRLITAENPGGTTRATKTFPCFNEAAAHHRGKRRGGTRRARRLAASMRPRLITAENLEFFHN